MFRKPKKKPSALRSGGGSGAASSAPAASAGKKRHRRRDSSSSSEGDGDHDGEGTSDLLHQIRRERDEGKSKKSSGALLNSSATAGAAKKKKADDNKGSWMHQYKSNDAQLTAKDMATRTAEYHPTESKPSVEGDEGAASQNASMAALQKQPRNKFLAGPLRAATFVRTTARFDYQPDICKDYKETGFCGFGDTCIYLHDRGDTKTGWQMEQEYEEKKKAEEQKRGREMERFMSSMMEGKGGAVEGDDEKDAAIKTDDGIPFACHICRGAFTNPIVTPCGHYFCEKCMLQKVREAGPGCPVCQKDTHGVLNHAQKLVAKKRRLVGRDGTWEEYLEKTS
ncbi:hypothetical protein ACHAXT_003526 [Thalassiosira profunda]